MTLDSYSQGYTLPEDPPGSVHINANNVVNSGEKNPSKPRESSDCSDSKIEAAACLEESVKVVRESDTKPNRTIAYRALKAIRDNQLAHQRVMDCGKALAGLVEGRENKHGELAFNKVETCGSVHSCPVCRNKIKPGREEELKALEEYIHDQGKQIYMMTLTCKHSRDDSLKALVGKTKKKTGFLGAWRIFSYSYLRSIKKKLSIQGWVRAMEDTVSIQTGWHYHSHIWLILDKPLSEKALRKYSKDIFKKWQKASEQAGLEKPSYQGFDLRAWEKGNTYLSKSTWTAASEIMGKKADGKTGVNVSQLERMLIDETYRNHFGFSLNQVKAFIKERSEALKGTRSITWSRNKWMMEARKTAIGEEKTDEQLAHMDEPEKAPLQLLFGPKLWNKVWWGGYMGDIKTMYKNWGVESIVEFVDLNFPEYIEEITHNAKLLEAYEYLMRDPDDDEKQCYADKTSIVDYLGCDLLNNIDNPV